MDMGPYFTLLKTTEDSLTGATRSDVWSCMPPFLYCAYPSDHWFVILETFVEKGENSTTSRLFDITETIEMVSDKGHFLSDNSHFHFDSGDKNSCGQSCNCNGY